MPNEHTSVLAQKISMVRTNAGSFPDLTEFSLGVAKAAGAASAELLQVKCGANSATRIASLKDILADRTDPGVNYWLTDESGADAILVCVAPQFAAAMTTRLLGGDFNLPNEDAKTTMIDFELAGALVDMLMPALNRLVHNASPSAPRNLLSGKRGVRTAKEATGEQPTLAMSEILIDFQLDGATAAKAVSIAIPARIIERIGLEGQEQAHGVDANAAWAQSLKRNILNTELSLAVVLDRIATNIGGLSRLQVGQIIDIDENALTRLELTAMTNAGPTSIAKGRLGAFQSRKAVKLTTGIDQDFLRGL